jgi:hypothetical protein
LSDFLDAKRREIADRLKELKPLVEEFTRLEAAAAALETVGGGRTAAASTPARRGRGRPRGRTTGTGRRPGRRKGSGTRAAQALSFVQGQPGITIPELADKMGIKQNYLYRVLPGLEGEGKVRKEGRGWHATASSK